MIKQEITLTIGESEYSGDLKVPSVVLTSTPQEEELDLTKSPNFQITINDNGDITDTVEVVFTAEKVDYTANMKVINRNGNNVTLQYVNGLTAEDAPEPEPEQSVEPTMYYDENTFTVSAVGEGTVIMLFDGAEISNPYTFEQTDEDVTYTVTATAQQDGKTVSDAVSCECFVPAASQPEEPSYSVKIFNRNGDSVVSLPWNYDLSGQNPTDSLDLGNASRVIPAMSRDILYSVKVFDNNTGEEVELTEANFSMAANGKSLVYWNSQYNNYTLDLQGYYEQGLTAADFLGNVTITVNDMSNDTELPFAAPLEATGFERLYEVTNNQQVIFNLEGDNKKMYLVDAYMASGTYYKDIIVTDGSGTNILIYNTDSSIADTTNFSTRSNSDYSGQTLTCKEMKINGSRIKWIAGTGTLYRKDLQLERTNLSAFTLDDNSTTTTDILYPEQTKDYNMATRWPVKINSALITATSADGNVSFSVDGETVTKHLYRCNSTDDTSVYNGQTCVLTGLLHTGQDAINWNSLTSAV